jgi:flagellar biosynthetic protein FliR
MVIGFLASLPNLAMNLAGFFMGHQMGLTLSQVYNPEIGADVDVLGQLLMYIGLGTFLAVGGLESCYLALVSTFERVPIGGFAITATPVETIVGVLTSGFELAIRVAAPVLAIIFLLMIALGFLMKTMPQINAMSVGFTIKILFGLAMLAVSVAAVQGAASEEIERVLGIIAGWSRSLG